MSVGPVGNLVEGSTSRLAETVAVFSLEVVVGELEDVVLTEVPPGQYLLSVGLQLPYQNLSTLHLTQLLLIEYHLLFKVHVLHLLSMVLLIQP